MRVAVFFILLLLSTPVFSAEEAISRDKLLEVLLSLEKTNDEKSAAITSYLDNWSHDNRDEWLSSLDAKKLIDSIERFDPCYALEVCHLLRKTGLCQGQVGIELKKFLFPYIAHKIKRGDDTESGNAVKLLIELGEILRDNNIPAKTTKQFSELSDLLFERLKKENAERAFSPTLRAFFEKDYRYQAMLANDYGDKIPVDAHADYLFFSAKSEGCRMMMHIIDVAGQANSYIPILLSQLGKSNDDYIDMGILAILAKYNKMIDIDYLPEIIPYVKKDSEDLAGMADNLLKKRTGEVGKVDWEQWIASRLNNKVKLRTKEKVAFDKNAPLEDRLSAIETILAERGFKGVQSKNIIELISDKKEEPDLRFFVLLSYFLANRSRDLSDKVSWPLFKKLINDNTVIPELLRLMSMPGLEYPIKIDKELENKLHSLFNAPTVSRETKGEAALALARVELPKGKKKSAVAVFQFLKNESVTRNNNLDRPIRLTIYSLKQLTGEDHGTDLEAWEKAINAMPDDPAPEENPDTPPAKKPAGDEAEVDKAPETPVTAW